MTTAPLLSIIIPAYNEQLRLPATLAAIKSYVSASNMTVEVEQIPVPCGASTTFMDRVRSFLAYKRSQPNPGNSEQLHRELRCIFHNEWKGSLDL